TTTTTTTTTTTATTSTTLTATTTTTATPLVEPTAQTAILLLLGASGSGKSLATQLLVNDLWQAFLSHPQKNLIPLRIELKQFSEKTVGQCVVNTLLDEYRYSPTELRELQKYPFVFILDGYDEIAGQAKVNLFTKHQATESQYGKWQAQFVITCRDSYYEG